MTVVYGDYLVAYSEAKSRTCWFVCEKGMKHIFQILLRNPCAGIRDGEPDKRIFHFGYYS